MFEPVIFKNYHRAKLVFMEFSRRPGNNHIASLFNLWMILNYTQFWKSRSILEIGSGIGTIINLFKLYGSKQLCYVGIEDNDFCLSQLGKYGLMDIERFDKYCFQVVHKVENITPQKFDFVIVDGKTDFNVVLEKIIGDKFAIFLEGTRQDQLENIKRNLELFGLPFFCFTFQSFRRNPAYGPFNPKQLQAGHTLFCVNPDTMQYLVYWIMRLREYVRAVFKRLGFLKKIKR